MKIERFYIVLFLSFFLGNTYGQIFVNQAGYLVDLPKFAVTNIPASSFQIIKASDNSVKFEGTILRSVSKDPATDEDIYQMDFSELDVEGLFFVKLNTGETSFQFPVGKSVFNKLYEESLKSFYFQRCGMELSSQYAGGFNHLKCHSIDATMHSTSGRTGFHLSIGGWHDAGDFGKYIVNAGITVGTMLLTYQLFEEKLNAENLSIPESVNGVADLLDEIRYELNWMLTMQDVSGGVYHKLTAENFAGFIMPNKDNGKRYIYEVSSTATADFAAVLAKASIVYKKIDSVFSNKCLEAAVKAWDFLEVNPTIVPAGGFKNPSEVNTGEYGDGNDKDERLWSSIELFLATDNTKYLDYYLANIGSVGLINTMSWANVRTLAHLSFLFFASDKNEKVNSDLRASLKNYCDQTIVTVSNNGFQVGLSLSEYNWGSNSGVLNKALLLLSAHILLDQKNYETAAIQQLNYVMGVNIHNISFVTGIGAKYPMNIHHRQSSADGLVEPIPGLIAGGPNRYLSDPSLQALFTSATPPAKCYADVEGSYASNETAINWNAPLVFVTAYFYRPDIQTSIGESVDQLNPKNIFLYQNYPNPFNGSTSIVYEINKPDDIHFSVYNLLGEIIFEKNYYASSEGRHKITWDVNSNDGYNIGSGIYLYRLESGNTSLVKKLTYIK